jgi:hypothetical protein
MLMMTASRLSDSDLTAELSRLAGGEREATAALIVHLAEFDARRLYEGAGYSSMFQYGRAVLRLSEDAVYNRIAAARAARRFPAIVDMLVTGALSVTTARLLARHLTSDNHETLLAAAAGLGKLAVEELLAGWFPQPDVAPRIRRLPDLPAVPSRVGVTAPLNPVAQPEPAAATPPDVRRDSCSVAQRTFGAAPAGSPSCRRPVRSPIYRERGDAREAARGAGSARARRSQRRSGPGVRPSPHPVGRGSQAAEVRGHAAARPGPTRR